MGWQRFNRTSRVFEVSDDNGASWQVLKIAEAGLDAAVPPNIAFTNVGNVFTANQMISAANAGLLLHASNGGANTKRWNLLSSGNEFYLQTYDDAGAFQANPFKFDRNGTLHVGWDLYSKAPIYPGRLDTGWTEQSSWYLAGHGSYGLYINTGLYVAGNIWTGGALIPKIWTTSDSTGFGIGSAYDLYIVNAISSSVTISVSAAGAYDGQPITIRLRDNGAARPIYWSGVVSSACGIALPSSTAPGRTIHMGFRWNTYYWSWQMIAISQE